MKETTSFKGKKELLFEKGGEIFSIEIEIKNISSAFEKDQLAGYLDVLYETAKRELIPLSFNQ